MAYLVLEDRLPFESENFPPQELFQKDLQLDFRCLQNNDPYVLLTRQCLRLDALKRPQDYSEVVFLLERDSQCQGLLLSLIHI